MLSSLDKSKLGVIFEWSNVNLGGCLKPSNIHPRVLKGPQVCLGHVNGVRTSGVLEILEGLDIHWEGMNDPQEEAFDWNYVREELTLWLELPCILSYYN